MSLDELGSFREISLCGSMPFLGLVVSLVWGQWLFNGGEIEEHEFENIVVNVSATY